MKPGYVFGGCVQRQNVSDKGILMQSSRVSHRGRKPVLGRRRSIYLEVIKGRES